MDLFFYFISTSFYNARNKKIAYDFIKRSQEPVALMIREPKDGFLSLVAVNEFLTDKTVKYKVTDLSNHTVLFNGEAVAKANDAVKLNSIPFLEGEIHFYLMEWQYDGISKKNHYISGKAPYNFNQYVAWLKETGLLSN